MTVDSLPRCFALHKPVPPNDCENCAVRGLCYKVILKSDLKPILERVEKIERIIRGEKV